MRVSYPRFFLFLLLLAVFCFDSLASGATLSQDEVEALKDIATTLGKKDWDFSVDPCSGERNWTSTVQVKGSENELRCNCSYNNDTVCHVTNIILKAQNLPGTLPQDLFRLPFIQEFDVSRNYLNGTIPKEWGTTKLLNISLLGNRLTGSIPKEIANISTLQSLVVEANQLFGELPLELGNLPQIQRLLLSSNNFTGKLPETLNKLTTLQDIRLGDNQFSGKIPDFIQSWTSLQKLVIQGSGFDGPLPSGISLLKNLTDLRISDLNGSEQSTFPQLNNMSLKYLILRNCNINGTLPTYLGTMTTLKNLDLSFNKLTGPIPSNYEALRKVDYIYLTGNLLDGEVPAWTDKADNVGAAACLGSNVCQKSSYSLHINCGGKMITEGKSTYDDDLDNGGPARFHRSGSKNWAFITTGNFMDKDAGDYSIWQNKSSLSVDNADLYMDARVSPTSLTYYGFCLGNGNYTVNLHFAEIMFINDQTFNSLGRRVFDIYIQGELVQKDFNIVEEAGGIGKAIIKNFTAVVSNNTLEIRLYWAGKGTTSLPFRSVYGPLISAISVEPNFTPPSEENGSSISAGAVAGIVVAVAIVIIIVLGILWWKGCLGKKSSLEKVCALIGVSYYWTFKTTGFLANGYMAPEYAMHGYLTDKADVYSFGIVVLEIINGRNNTIHRPKEQSFSILEWANLLKEKGDLMDLVDRRLGTNFNKEEVLVLIRVALLCTNVTTQLRPSMSAVVSMLEGRTVVEEVFSEANDEEEKKMEKMRLYYQELSISKDEPWTSSSTSAADLYPVNIDSSYLQKRG
ncbi:hypothetical protein V8G54_027083 [Vigna mungo]|uniref:non-specific serine/threonine protein kinase n=1 Tax=Vigna mungo TaxID=3915 RepID=A0AAQ3RMQ9_VIGMU